jgi:hypothetical protein
VYGRTTFMREIKAAIVREAGADFPVLLKYTAVEETPFGRGITLEEGVQVARIAEEAGFVALTPVIADALPNSSICRGDFPGRSFDSPAMRKRLLSATGSRLRSAACSPACGSPPASTPSRRCGTATCSPPSRPPCQHPRVRRRRHPHPAGSRRDPRPRSSPT